MFSLFVTALSLFTLTQSVLYPISSQRRSGRNVYYDASDFFRTGMYVGPRPSYGRFAAEDVDNRFSLRFNPREITKITDKISRLSNSLGFDADDIDDIAVTTACAIIGAACALANTGLSIYDRVKSDDEEEALAFDAEDVNHMSDKFSSLSGLQTKDIHDELMNAPAVIHRHLVSNVPRHLVSNVPRHLVSNVPRHLVSNVPRHLVSNVPRHVVSTVPKKQPEKVK